ncbi:hypothetical protein PMIN04_007603 [Paraphaeosphaeria minitans]
MILEFTDAQRKALASYGKPLPINADVRTWPIQDRTDLLFSSNLITIFMEAQTPCGSVYNEICALPRYILAAVSPTFANHLLQKPDLESFVFDIGHMDTNLQEEHRKAVETLYTWLTNLSIPLVFDLKAPTFYSEISLRHIARQLGMSFYLTERTDELIHDAQTHILQPWQVTEMLYASSIETNAALPLVMENDPLLGYLAEKMLETTDSMWEGERDKAFKWMRREENIVLLDAVQKLHEKRQRTAARC